MGQLLALDTVDLVKRANRPAIPRRFNWLIVICASGRIRYVEQTRRSQAPIMCLQNRFRKVPKVSIKRSMAPPVCIGERPM